MGEGENGDIMSERLRKAYLKRWNDDLRKRVHNQPWNKKHLAKMHKAGREFKERCLSDLDEVVSG